MPCFHGFVDNNEQYIGTKSDSQSGPQEGTTLWITQLCYEFDVLRKSFDEFWRENIFGNFCYT